MAQTWSILAGTDTISDIDDYTSVCFGTLRSSWSGTSAPSGMVAGQTWYCTSTSGDHAYGFHVAETDNATPRLMFHANQDYGGLLPKTAGASYPLSGDLYMGGKKLINMGSGSASTDGATIGDISSTIAGHDHTGGEEGPKLAWSILTAGGSPANALLQIAADATLTSDRRWDLNYASTFSPTTSMATIASCTVTTHPNERKLIIAGVFCRAGYLQDGTLSAAPSLQICRDATTILGPTTYAGHEFGTIMIATTNSPNPSADQPYNWILQGKLSGSYDTASGWQSGFIFVF